MSAVLAEKAVEMLGKRENERAKTVKLFHRNAAIKHGIPWEDMDGDQDSATEEKTETTTELSIIDKMVDKLVDKVGTQHQPAMVSGRDGRDGKDGASGKDADPNAVAEIVAKQIAGLLPKAGTGKTSLGDLLKVAALSALGTGAVAGPIGYFASRGDDKPPVIVEQEKTGSLLQYLEDEGYSVGSGNGN